MSQLQYSYLFDYIAPEHTTGLTDRYIRVHAHVPLTHSLAEQSSRGSFGTVGPYTPNKCPLRYQTEHNTKEHT